MKTSNNLSNLVEIIRRKYKVCAIILFGSRARGDWGPWSDYDVLIIGNFHEPYIERIKNILESISDLKIPIEPHPYTFEEARRMLLKGNPIIVDALEEGIILFKTDKFEKITKLYELLKKKGMKRTNVTIIVPRDIDNLL